jgi:hypothetical protein
LKAESKKIFSKALAGFIFGQLFGPIGLYIGSLLGDHISELGKEQIKKIFHEFGEESGKTLVESESGIKGFLKQKFNWGKSFEIDYSLASLLCKVWEERLNKIIKEKEFEDSRLKIEVELLKKFRDNFKEAQKGETSIRFYEIFPKNDSTDFSNELKNFETITGQNENIERLWDILQKTLTKWRDEADEKTFQSLKDEIKIALTENLQNDFLVQIKNNEKFSESFKTTFEFFVAEKFNKQDKKLDKLAEKVNKQDKKLDKLGEHAAKLQDSLFPKADFNSPELKKEVIAYLHRVAKEAVDIKTYFPQHLKQGNDGNTPFDEIRQRVSVTEKKSWDEIKAKIEEQNKLRGISSFEEDKTAHKYHLTIGLDMEQSQGAQVRIIDWDENVANEFKRAIFLGDPGFGKTWLLSYEARRIALNSKRKLENSEISLKDVVLPIKLRLSSVAEKASADKILTQTFSELTKICGESDPFSKSFEKYVQKRIKAEENVVILLDALDEVPENPQYGIGKEKLRKKIEDFSSDKPKISLYLTSRIVGYDSLNIKDAKELELLPFKDEQIKRFTKVWFNDNKIKEKIFQEFLDNQPQTAGLAQIPLMLSLLCKLFVELDVKETFPETRSEIYKKCLVGLLRDWKKENERKSISDEELIFRLKFLEKLAFKLFEKKQEQFAETSFTEILCETLNISPEDFSAEAKVIEWKNRLEKDGIIKKAVKGENPEYLFLHLTFQEYLAASCIAKMDNQKEFVFREKILFNPNWQEILTLLGGILSKDKAKDYIKALLEVNGEIGEGDVLFRPFLLAILAAKEAEKSLDEDFIKSLIERTWKYYLEPPDYIVKEGFLPAIKAWKHIFITYLLNEIELSLASEYPSGEYLKTISHTLSLLKADSSLIAARLIKVLEDFEIDRTFRWSISVALGFQLNFSEEIITELFEIQKKDIYQKSAYQNLLAALQGQSNLKAERIDEITRILEYDVEDESVRRKAADVLGAQSQLNTNIIDRMVDILTVSKDDYFEKRKYFDSSASNNDIRDVQEKIAEALISQEYLNEAIINRLRDFARDNKNHEYVRIAVLLIFDKQKTKDFKTIQLVRSILGDENEPNYIRRNAAIFLGNQKELDSEILSFFKSVLRTQFQKTEFCEGIIYAFAMQKNIDNETFEIFKEILFDESYRVTLRIHILFALERKKELVEEINEELFRLLEDVNENYVVKRYIFSTLIKNISDDEKKIILLNKMKEFGRDTKQNFFWERNQLFDSMWKAATDLRCAVPLKGEIIINK